MSFDLSVDAADFFAREQTRNRLSSLTARSDAEELKSEIAELLERPAAKTSDDVQAMRDKANEIFSRWRG